MSSKLNLATKVMTEANKCHGAYSEVILAKYGRDVAGALAGLINIRDFLDSKDKLPSNDWFFVEWIRFEKKVGMKRKVIQKVIGTLVEEGLVEFKKGGPRMSPSYKINIGKVIDAAKIEKSVWSDYTKSKSNDARLEKVSFCCWVFVDSPAKNSGVPTGRQVSPQASRCPQGTVTVSPQARQIRTIKTKENKNEKSNRVRTNISSKCVSAKKRAHDFSEPLNQETPSSYNEDCLGGYLEFFKEPEKTDTEDTPAETVENDSDDLRRIESSDMKDSPAKVVKGNYSNLADDDSDNVDYDALDDDTLSDLAANNNQRARVTLQRRSWACQPQDEEPSQQPEDYDLVGDINSLLDMKSSQQTA